jgi:hypothetical protein
MPDAGLYEANLRDITTAMSLLRRVLTSMEEHHGRLVREQEEDRAARTAAKEAQETEATINDAGEN